MKLFYILGNTRSGSTFFSRVLNQHSEIFTTGELTYLDKDPRPGEIECSCKVMNDRDTCTFWPEVIRQFKDRGGDLEKMGSMHLDNRLEWVKALLCGSFPSLSEEFLEQNRLFFEVMAENTEASCLLDTSKRHWRLLPFVNSPDFSVKILHVIKSPENLLHSKLKRGNGFWHSAILKYFRINYLTRKWYEGSDQYTKIRFEEFIQSPQPILREVLNWLELEFEDPFEKDQVEFHNLRGSRGKAITGPLEPDPSVPDADPDFSPLQKKCISMLKKLY